MNLASPFASSLAALGFLRLSLFSLVILDVLWSGCYRLAGMIMDTTADQSIWVIIPTLIAPVMAPILVVVILFDYTMWRVRAADEQGEARAQYLSMGRIDLIFIGLLLLYWIPFFVTL